MDQEPMCGTCKYCAVRDRERNEGLCFLEPPRAFAFPVPKGAVSLPRGGKHVNVEVQVVGGRPPVRLNDPPCRHWKPDSAPKEGQKPELKPEAPGDGG